MRYLLSCACGCQSSDFDRVLLRTWRFERGNRDIKQAGDARRSECQHGFAAELTYEAVLNQARAKAVARRSANGRAAAFNPIQSKLVSRVIEGRCYVDPAVCV